MNTAKALLVKYWHLEQNSKNENMQKKGYIFILSWDLTMLFWFKLIKYYLLYMIHIDNIS